MKVKLNKISIALKKHSKALIPTNMLYKTVALSLLASPVYAEDVAKKEAEQEIEVISVSGMHGTMTRSLNEKKNTIAIVDAIAAADFGELPGLSLSDIIENVSGASAHRLKGSQNEISIRGIGSYWGYSTFNGRTITNAGPGRAVNFKKFPSSLVDKVVIYKTQQADLVEGGTSGTIDVNSLRAVDYGKNSTTVEATGIYNTYYEDHTSSPWGSKFVLSTVQSWETENAGSVGFTFGASHSNTANPEENFGGSSQMGVCALRLADGTALSDNGNDCTNSSSDQAVSAGRDGRTPTPGIDTNLADYDPSSIFYVPNDVYWRTGEDEDKRTNIVTTFQWVPNDQLNINFDYEYSRLEYNEQRMEFGLDTRRRKLTDHIIADDHTLLYAKGEARPQIMGEARSQVDDYNGFGLNVEYMASEDLELSLDASYSKSYRYRLRQRSRFRSEERYQYELDFRDREVAQITFLDDNRLGAGEAGYDASEVFDPTNIQSFVHDGTAWADYRRANDEREDDIFAVNFDANYSLDNEIFSSIKAGIRYSSEHLIDETSNDVSLLLTDGSQRNGSTDTDNNDWDDDNPAAHIALTSGIVENCVNDHENGNLFDDQTGGGAGDYVTYDSKCLIGQMLGQVPGNDGNTDFYDIGELDDKRSGGDRDITEKILAAYIMADIDTHIGDMPVRGNVGLRVVKTDTNSTGWGDKVYITTNDDGTFEADTNITGEIEVLTLDSSYTKYLPSLNLTFEITDEWYVKTAAYRAMSRFQLNAMSSGVGYDVCDTTDDSICDENTNTDYSQVVQGGDASGNHMNPYMSSNFDVSIEYYPSSDAAITLGMYYKDFTGGYDQVTESRDITVSLDGVDTTYTNVSHSTQQTSDKSSTIKGFEITAQKHFVELPEPFNGLGAKIAYNYADSSFVTPEVGSPGIVPDANLFGFSKNVASGSVYWEGDALSLRLMYKHRSKYFQPNNLPFPTRSHRYVQAASYLDFAAKYKINSDLSVSLKALNLTDEPQVMTRGNDTTIADYSRSGPKIFLGAKYKF